MTTTKYYYHRKQTLLLTKPFTKKGVLLNKQTNKIIIQKLSKQCIQKPWTKARMCTTHIPHHNYLPPQIPPPRNLVYIKLYFRTNCKYLLLSQGTNKLHISITHVEVKRSPCNELVLIKYCATVERSMCPTWEALGNEHRLYSWNLSRKGWDIIKGYSVMAKCS